MSKFSGKKEPKVTDSKLCYYLQSFKLKKLLIDNISRNCVVEIVVPQTDYKESNENLDSETNKILDVIPEEALFLTSNSNSKDYSGPTFKQCYKIFSPWLSPINFGFKSLVYKYFVAKKWIVTDGNIYGCDFLIYRGNPDKHHSKYGVLCIYDPEIVMFQDLIARQRIINSVNKKKQTYLVRTIRKSRTFAPKIFADTKKFNIDTTNYLYNGKTTILQYSDKKNKSFMLLSTFHHKPLTINSKPEIVDLYNKYKAGVDRMDQVVQSYSCKRITRRWALAIFSIQLI